MSVELGEASILKRASCCVVRKQREEVLIYNTRTDELHLIPPAGFYIYKLFDGARALGEIEIQLEELLATQADKVACPLRTFVGQLLARGILEEDRGPAN